VLLESVNVGHRTVIAAARLGESGIVKQPVDSARITIDGVDGDVIVDTDVHGGPDQAVYVYARDDYDHWAAELRRPLTPGSFGENLTVSTMGGAPVRVGDRYRIGAVLLEVTMPRVPCRTFAAVMDEPDWVRRFRSARRPGYYCRVLSEGDVAAGDPIERLAAPGTNVTIDELADLFADRSADRGRVMAALRSPVAQRGRAHLERRLGLDGD
jgi:MOSC domain-containing protein YiiM